MLPIDSLTYCTFNVNGLQNDVKRRKIFGIIRDHKIDIAFLQECHSTSNKELIWQNEFGGNVFYSNGTSDSRGVMILFRRGLVYNIKNIQRDLDGRMLIIEIVIDKISFLLCNIYSPNEDKPQFFVQVVEAIESCDNRNIIWGGDFNLVLDTSLDRHNSEHNNQKSLDIVKAYMEDAELNDIFRIKNPIARTYSWFRHKPLAMSRIDFFLISSSLMPFVEECKIIATPCSDHSLVKLHIQFSPNERGPGLWQFNTSHLNNEEFINKLKQKVDEVLDGIKNKSPTTKWHELKQSIIRFCQEESKHVANRTKGKILALYDKLKDFREMCYANPSDISQLQWQEYENINIELDGFLQKRANGARLRSRTKWYSEGERSSKYFFSLEKANATKKQINALQTNRGKVVTAQKDIIKEQVEFYQKLYASDNTVQFSLNLPEDADRLSNEDKEFMDRPLTYNEISSAVLAMPNNKTPGEDGLPIEIFKILWGKIGIIY